MHRINNLIIVIISYVNVKVYVKFKNIDLLFSTLYDNI